MAGSGADEFSGFRREQVIDGARVRLLDCLASQDHRAGVDIPSGETGIVIALMNEVPELLGIDGAVRHERREHDRRAPDDLAADNQKTAGKPESLPLQRDLSEEEMGRGAADID